MFNRFRNSLPPEWQSYLKDHLVFFAFQTMLFIVELLFITVWILLLRAFSLVHAFHEPDGFDPPSIVTMLLKVVTLVLIFVFVLSHATTILKWSIENFDIKWLLRIVKTLRRRSRKS